MHPPNPLSTPPAFPTYLPTLHAPPLGTLARLTRPATLPPRRRGDPRRRHGRRRRRCFGCTFDTVDTAQRERIVEREVDFADTQRSHVC